MNSTLLKPIVVIAATMAFTAANYGQQQKPEDGFKIGVILATSGPASEIGDPEEKILKALMSEGPYAEPIPGIGKITLEYRDSSGRPEQALEYLEQFHKDPKVVAVIGPSTSSEAIPLARKAAEYKLPLLALAASKKIAQHPEDPSRANPWVFQFAQNDELAAQKLLATLVSQSGNAKIAFLYSDDGFGKSGADAFLGAAKRASGIQVAHHQSYPHELTSPEGVINAIPKEASAVVIWGTSSAPAALITSLRKTKPNVPIYLSHGNASPAFLTAVGPAGEGVILVGSRVLLPLDPKAEGTERDKTIQSFQTFWAGRFNSPPSHFAGHARDALESVFNVLQKTGSKTSRDQVRATLESSPKFAGVTGVFHFTPEDHAGLDPSALEVFVVRDGRFVTLGTTKQ